MEFYYTQSGEALKQAQVNEEQRFNCLKRVRNAFQERAPATETRPKISLLTGRRIGLQVSPEVTIWTQVGVSFLLLAAGVWIVLSNVYPPEDERWGYSIIGLFFGFWFKR